MIWPIVVSASSTLLKWSARPPDRSTSMALPGPEPDTYPAITVPLPARFSCCATDTRVWLSPLALVAGGVPGIITTARVARAAGFPLVLRKPPAA